MESFKSWEKRRSLVLMDNYRQYIQEALDSDNVETGDLMKETLGFWEFARRKYLNDLRREAQGLETIYYVKPPRKS